MNPHDKLFKATFSEKELVIDFIKHFLPAVISEKIDLDALTLLPNSYIGPSLKGFYSDIVYRTQLGGGGIQIALLFEHKSYVEPYPHLQVLRYMVEAWFQMIGQKEKIKPIIPIVFYHGEENWLYKPFLSYFDPIDPILSPFMPTFDYLLADMSQWSDEQLEGMSMGIIQQALLLFKHGRDSNYMHQYFQKLFSSLESYSKNNQYTNLIISFSVYIIAVGGISKKDFVKLVQELPPTINEHIMTTYEQIIKEGEKRGEKRGIAIGKKLGEEQASRAKENLVISQGMKSGLELALIAKLVGLSVEEVETRIQELGLS